MPRRLIPFLLLLVSALVCARVPDFADLVAESSPAVVKIQTEEADSPAPDDFPPVEELPEIFRELFGRQGIPNPSPNGAASGFVLSADGYVVTNHHVVAGAGKIKVTLIDRREFVADIIGVDARSDLALLKISADGLSSVTFAEDDQLRVGEWVIAIGSPFGLDYSASVGIVSAIGRSLPTGMGENYVPFIQTDVAINPGSSGGPLFNQDGEVVGINSQIYTSTGGSVGISFAIPVAVAKQVIAQLKAKGRVERGWLGVYIQEVDQALAETLGMGSPRGALVADVMPEGPASEAGLRPGDVILTFAGKPVAESSDLPHMVGLVAPGTRAQLQILRGGKELDLAVEIGALPSQLGPSPAAASQYQGDPLGLSIHEIDGATAKAFNLPGGVVVEKVYPNSPASYTGLMPGDVIVQIGSDQIDGEQSYRATVKGLPKGVPSLIRFLRKGKFVFRTIELPP